VLATIPKMISTTSGRQELQYPDTIDLLSTGHHSID